MKFATTYKVEDFILNTRWEDLPEEVQTRMLGCFVDLMGALPTPAYNSIKNQ